MFAQAKHVTIHCTFRARVIRQDGRLVVTASGDCGQQCDRKNKPSDMHGYHLTFYAHIPELSEQRNSEKMRHTTTGLHKTIWQVVTVPHKHGLVTWLAERVDAVHYVLAYTPWMYVHAC